MQLLNNASKKLREMLASLQAMEAEVDANLKTRIDNLEDMVDGLDVGEVRGEPGKSAYQVWLDQGNAGSEAQFIESLKGVKGDPGNQGNPGTNGTNGVDGAPGQNATDSQVEAKVNAWLTAHPPAKGDRGEQGIQGIPGNSGTNGVDGAAATISVGTITTGNPGTNAAITNSGSSNAAVLNFTIPRGEPGAQGIPGVSGDSRIKFAATNQSTNSSGIYTRTFAANQFVKSPAIFITPRTNTPLFMYGVTTSGTAATGFTVTVTFFKLKASILALGTLTEATASIGVVNFDIQAVEPD